MDNPRVRAWPQCPVCSKGKDAGLIVCWTCYRQQGLRYGMSEAVARTIANLECALVAREAL